MDVKLPDGTIGRFPDDMPQEKIEAVLQNQFGQKDDTISQHEGIPRAAVQGASFGFGDEIISGLGAIPSSLITGNTISDSYGQILDDERMRSKTFAQESPVSSALSEVGGAVLTGVGGMGTKAGAKLASSLTQGSAPVKILKGAGVGGLSGGTYGYGSSDGENTIDDIMGGVVFGGATGGAIPAIGSLVKSTGQGLTNTYKGFKARDTQALSDVGQAIKDKSSKAYEIMRNTGVTFKPESTNKIMIGLDSALKKDGKLNPRLHDKIFGLMEDMRKEVGQDGVTLESLDQWRQLFGEVSGNFMDKTNARKASIVMRKLDESIRSVGKDDILEGSTNAIDALNLGRSEWARQSKFNAISDIVKKSEGDANYLKRELKKFYNNPKKTRGFNTKEIESLHTAATQTTGEGVLKMLGKFGFDLGSSLSVGNTALPLLGGFLGSPLLTTAGTAARSSHKYISRGKAEDLLKLIAEGGDVSLKEIEKLPTKEAEKVLRSLTQSTSITQGNK